MVGGTGRAPKELSDHLGARDSGLRTGQAKFRADVPEEFAPPPTKGLMATVLVADIAENLSGFNVGENVQHPEQFAVDAAGPGDYSREEGTAMVRCKVVKNNRHGRFFPGPKMSARSRFLVLDPIFNFETVLSPLAPGCQKELVHGRRGEGVKE